MFILYDLITLIIVIIFLPAYWWKRKFHPGFMMRLGKIPEGVQYHRPIWVHAVSVGEAVAMRPLVEVLRCMYPERQFVFSTVTPTGNKIVKEIAQKKDVVLYLPLDFSFIVKKVIRIVNPSLCIIAETELWPNFITALFKHKIPIVVVNGRISDASFSGYRKISFLCKGVMSLVSIFCVQALQDKGRLLQLGVPEDKIRITGNMKFDGVESDNERIKSFSDRFKTILKMKDEEALLVAGSTHPGEEEILLRVYKKLILEFPHLRLLIAPRHPERRTEIKNLIAQEGLTTILLSKLETLTTERDKLPVFVLDMIGQLMYVYALAKVVFIGGSLIKKGGHNILEPAAVGKPVIFGPYTFNFKDITELFLQHQAAIKINDEHELTVAISRLLKEPAAVAEITTRAKELMSLNQGAALRTAEEIKKLL